MHSPLIRMTLRQGTGVCTYRIIYADTTMEKSLDYILK